MTCWTAIPALGNQDAYFRAIDKFPMLTLEEEVDAGNIKDEASIMKLVLSHLRLAASIARKYYTISTGGAGDSDLIQEANVALLQAAARFEPAKGRFSSFATRYINAAIHGYIMKNHRIVKIATTKAHKTMYFNLGGAKRKLLTGTNRISLNEKEIESIAKEYDVRPEDVIEMEKRLVCNDFSIFTPGNGSEGEWSLEDMLPDVYHEPLAALERAERHYLETEGAREALNTLDDREKFIIENRYMVEKPLTLTELGSIFGVSFERIRQLEARALKKMREHLMEYA